MGTYDNIIIKSEKLHVSSSEKKIIKNKVFQTKDLEKLQSFYEITDEREHVLHNESNEKTLKLIPYLWEMDNEDYVEVNNMICEKIPFHGLLSFYTSLNNFMV